MKKEFIKEIGEIYRLKIPFENLYTSVFLLLTDGKYTLVDCATSSQDVDEWIEPALKKLGLRFSEIDCVIVTHEHSDHAGGLPRILQKNPNVCVMRTVQKMNGIEICSMHGHTKDFVGIFEPNSKTLISGDGLQGAGVGKYRCSLESKEEYLKTIEKIEQDERIENILFSHAYEPWYKNGSFGREAVKQVLKDCKKYV